ncbi:hypothetical protein FE394_02770 [Xenorhabdus sp. Reich]|uniref:Uncharacterized protein n=1 Tax=Xenorhabdus littoralis TaxID=2582835 RepID=A0ABU4SHS5_9GAMM|nr:hypothetical protein [Xenorhabdus sp. Reich]MDX7998146.1 hypothetical protein [Xenorhabdus sp. Reich]
MHQLCTLPEIIGFSGFFVRLADDELLQALLLGICSPASGNSLGIKCAEQDYLTVLIKILD